MNSQPISILMPIRNGIEFLPQSKADITLNARPQDEIILVDDNSDDNSNSFLQKWQKEDSRVRVLTNPANNQGLANALNLGIREATYSLIGRFDVDDKYDSNRLKLQLTEFLNSGPVGVFSDYSFFSESEKYLGKMPSPIYPAPTSISLLTNRRTPHSSALLSKAAVLEVGGYRQQDFPADDLSLWLRLSRVGNLITIPKTLLNYRISSKSVTALRQEKMISQRKALQIEIGINKNDYIFALSNLKSILQSYSGHADENLRKILFLKDLADGCKETATRKELLTLFSKIIVKVPSSPRALWEYKKFYSETKIRQAIRKSNF